MQVLRKRYTLDMGKTDEKINDYQKGKYYILIYISIIRYQTIRKIPKGKEQFLQPVKIIGPMQCSVDLRKYGRKVNLQIENLSICLEAQINVRCPLEET